MSEYAIYEASGLVKSLSLPVDDNVPAVRYLCALFAELAYYHIPEWEIDGKKRAKLIPCKAYQTLLADGLPINLNVHFQELELPGGFAVADRGVVAIGVIVNKLLFIGFRGTQFLFDWRINLRAKLVRLRTPLIRRRSFIMGMPFGRFHSGFAEEAARISMLIRDAIHDAKLDNIDHVFLTGHSLGGAIAAISENLVGVGPTSVCTFGAPRYEDLAAGYSGLMKNFPAHVRRSRDVVPTVPPRVFGYADHLHEFTTSGAAYVDPAPYRSTSGELARWAQFLAGRFEPHNMELYRQEIGVASSFQGATLPLAPIDRLKKAHTK